MLRVPFISLILIFFVILSGCVAESVNPLSDPKTAKYDDRLVGVWRSTFNGDDVYLHFGNKDDASMDIIIVEHEKDCDMDFSRYVIFPTIIDKTYYMNVQRKDPEQMESKYIFVKYEISKKTP